MLKHKIPWQSVLGDIFIATILFVLLIVLSIISGYLGFHYLIASLFLISTFGIIIFLIPTVLNLSRSFFGFLFILLFAQIFETILSFALHYVNSGILAANGEVNTSLGDCFYFSITTFTTLGYGDFQPKPEMRLATSIEALFGMVSMAIGASMIWLWCREHLVPKEMAFFDGNRRHKKSLTIHRIRIRTITGKERKLNNYVLPPKEGEKYRYDREREEWEPPYDRSYRDRA